MDDLQLQHAIYQCRCPHCRNALDEIARDHEAINRVAASLNERQRRLFVGLLALRQGHGGIVALAEITGLSRTTIRRGISELQSGIGAANDRVRRAGGGRLSVEKKRLRP